MYVRNVCTILPKVKMMGRPPVIQREGVTETQYPVRNPYAVGGAMEAVITPVIGA